MAFIEIGSIPCDENCAQIGPDQPDNGPELNRLECRAYIVGLRARYGDEPEGCRLRIKSNRHDFGTYCEVVCDYDDTKEICCSYAQRVEAGLSTFAEVGMWHPVVHADGVAMAIIRDPSLWFQADNPQRLYEKPATPA